MNRNPIDAAQVTDLRSAIELLAQYEGEYIETDEPVDPQAELSGVYPEL